MALEKVHWSPFLISVLIKDSALIEFALLFILFLFFLRKLKKKKKLKCSCPVCVSVQELEERLRQQHHMELQSLREAHRQKIETLKQQSEQELQTLRFELEDEGKAMLGKADSDEVRAEGRLPFVRAERTQWI